MNIRPLKHSQPTTPFKSSTQNNHPSKQRPNNKENDLPLEYSTQNTKRYPAHISISNRTQQYSSLAKISNKQTTLTSKNGSNQLQSSNVANSKWLDSDKEMMEFIMGLKSRKSGGKLCGKKGSEGFELDERKDEKEDYLCHKMLIVKRVERHEKEAINYFYDKDYERSFGQLSKAENLLKKEKVESAAHTLYLHYLHAQFYYKMSNSQWKVYLNMAKSFIQQIHPNEVESLKHYIWSVKALDICLVLQNQQYEKVVIYAKEFSNLTDKFTKIRRRVSFALVIALQKLGQQQQAFQIVERELSALQFDGQINSKKREQERYKLLSLKIGLTVELGTRQDGIKLIEELIDFEQVAMGELNEFTFYNQPIYQAFAELLKKDQNNNIKLIYFYEKWIQAQPLKKQKLKLQLHLFQKYFEMGIYQRALELFEEISSESVVYLGPEYLYMLAIIKNFGGQEKEAISILSKIIDICQTEDLKLLFSFRILEFNLQSKERQAREHNLQKMIKTCAKTDNYQEVSMFYFKYLRRGDGACWLKNGGEGAGKGGVANNVWEEGLLMDEICQYQ